MTIRSHCWGCMGITLIQSCQGAGGRGLGPRGMEAPSMAPLARGARALEMGHSFEQAVSVSGTFCGLCRGEAGVQVQAGSQGPSVEFHFQPWAWRGGPGARSRQLGPSSGSFLEPLAFWTLALCRSQGLLKVCAHPGVIRCCAPCPGGPGDCRGPVLAT